MEIFRTLRFSILRITSHIALRLTRSYNFLASTIRLSSLVQETATSTRPNKFTTLIAKTKVKVDQVGAYGSDSLNIISS